MYLRTSLDTWLRESILTFRGPRAEMITASTSGRRRRYPGFARGLLCARRITIRGVKCLSLLTRREVLLLSVEVAALLGPTASHPGPALLTRTAMSISWSGISHLVREMRRSSSRHNTIQYNII